MKYSILNLEAGGFSLCEIVKELSQKYQKTERPLYYDASTRDTWQPLYTQLFELDKARLIVMNRYNYIYREASFNYRQGYSSQKPTYLKLMLEVTRNLIELLVLQLIKDSQDKVERMEHLKKEQQMLEKLLEIRN